MGVFLAAGGHDTPNAFPSCLKRLRGRLRAVGLTLHTLSEGRWMLEVAVDRGVERVVEAQLI